jgi:hypothetical protein
LKNKFKKKGFTGISALIWIQKNENITKEEGLVLLEFFLNVGVFRNCEDFTKHFEDQFSSYYQFTEWVETKETVEEVIIKNVEDVLILRKFLGSGMSLQQFYADFLDEGLQGDSQRSFTSKLLVEWISKTYNIGEQAAIHVGVLLENDILIPTNKEQKKFQNNENTYVLINFMDFIDNLNGFIQKVKKDPNYGVFTYLQV